MFYLFISKFFSLVHWKQDEDEESNDSEISDFEIDETTLETYLTPIDDEEADNPVDEFIAFQQTITRT